MTNSARRSLPLFGNPHTGRYQTCRYKCGYDCWHDAPNTSKNETFESVVARSLSRRDVLRAGAASVVMVAGATALGRAAPAAAQTKPGAGNGAAPDGLQALDAKRLRFTPIEPTTADAVVVPDGYASEVLIRWGDPIIPGTRRFRFGQQTPEDQSGQFGYNCDFVAFMPLPFSSRFENSRDALLWVNHEYTNPEIMFEDYEPDAPSKEHVDIQMYSMGGSIVQVRRRSDRTTAYRRRSGYNRRITVFTPMELTGPAAGDELLQTNADPSGTRVLGMLNNCAGGVTPWGTILTCEENFHFYFANFDEVDFDALEDGDRLEKLGARYGVRGTSTLPQFERYYDRFDLTKEPKEVNRFGYVVEIDPYDPEFTPKKRTAMGRFKHEGATASLAADNRVAFYMGDDERFEYVYKFVTAGTFDEANPDASRDLLDDGTLYVARFDVDDAGNRVGEWLPLVHGENGLTEQNGFADQAEVVINARGAGDVLGATKMDRPEDIQRNPVNGGVYINLTNNTNRGVRVDNGTPDPNDDFFYPGEGPANPRGPNPWGHVIELFEGGNDAAATSFTWSIFILAGDPDDPSTYFAGFDKSEVSPIAAPDNLAFDNQGNMIIATDGQPGTLGFNDAFHFVPVSGPERGHVQQFLSVPRGAEACGPELTPDNQTLFCAVQHPGDDGTLAEPQSDWPDGSQPPRPSVVTVRKTSPGDPRIGA